MHFKVVIINISLEFDWSFSPIRPALPIPFHNVPTEDPANTTETSIYRFYTEFQTKKSKTNATLTDLASHGNSLRI